MWGLFSTKGWEAHVDGDILKQKKGFTWNVGINASQSKSNVDYLPDNVIGVLQPLYMEFREFTQRYHERLSCDNHNRSCLLRNSAGQKLIDPTTGTPLVSSAWSVLGDREPKLRFGVTNSLSYKAFSLTALFEGRYKATVINGTKRSMMSNGTSWESEICGKPVLCFQRCFERREKKTQKILPPTLYQWITAFTVLPFMEVMMKIG